MGEVDSAAIGGEHEPLLLYSSESSSSRYNAEEEVKKTKSVFSVLGIGILRLSIWSVFAAWIILLFMLPIEWFHLEFEEWIEHGGGSLFGIEGRAFLVYSLPIMIVVLLALAYKIVTDSNGEEEQLHLQKKVSEKPMYKLWTFPVLVDGPLGVVSAAEVIGILIFVFYLIWAFLQFNLRNIKEASGSPNKLFFLSYLFGICFGEMGRSIMALLFLPIARGSALLRLINVPFEHAAKYHIWIGNLTMTLFTLHGISMAIAYAAKGDFLAIFTWLNYGGANLPGVIGLFIGFAMWITSIHQIRTKYFETFFYTHQLYVLFLIFFALHVGDFFYAMAAGGIFIFMADRFLRFIQSRSITDIVSAKYFPCGAVELALSKPANLRYNALSFVFLQIRELSWLQWHPFSISSSPLDGKDHLSVMIKVQGKWTTKLKEKISNTLSSEATGFQREQHFKLTASVEGPYGYELPYYIEYENLILVAGGIGISPFLAILNDISYRITEGTPCLPRNISLIWAIKKSNELPLLSGISRMGSICPSSLDKLNVEIHIYVTQESEPSLALEEGNGSVDSRYDSYQSRGTTINRRRISNLVGTGNYKWLFAYFMSSTIGFVITKAVLDQYYINPLDVRAWWYKGVLLVACTVVGVVIFGGPVIGLWHLWETKFIVSESENGVHHVDQDETLVINNDSNGEYLFKNKKIIRYGSRPNFQEILLRLKEQRGGVDVGVIVCGPSSLETGVARECRTLNVGRRSHDPIFHFHTHSFSL